MENSFMIIGLTLGISSILAFIAYMLKQPLLLGYILAGVILGPVLGIMDTVKYGPLIHGFMDIGIAFLLFSVGLEVDLSKLKKVGLVAIIGGLAKIGITFSIGYYIGLLLNLSSIESVYLGLMLSFGSTMIVVKILSDKRELDTLHGRIIVGFLLMEDFVAIAAITLLSNTGMNHTISLIPVVKTLSATVLIILLARLIFPFMFKQAAKNPELLFILSVGVALLFGVIFPYVGLPLTIGTFLAGLLLGNLPYSIEIKGRIKPLKDFFLTIAFVSMGLGFSLSDLSHNWKIMLVILGLVIIIKPLIIFFITLAFKYTSKTSFFTGISLAQTSEFILILLAQGVNNMHIEQGLYSIGIVTAVATMAITPYLINGKYNIYQVLKPILKRLKRIFRRSRTPEKIRHKKHDIIVIGYDRLGYGIVRYLLKKRKDFIIVDYNPDIISYLLEQGIPCIYGDIGDPETLEEIDLSSAKMIISTAPNFKDNLFLLSKAKEANEKIIAIVTAQRVEEALQFYEKGADYVILPHLLGGEHAAILLEEVGDDLDRIIAKKIEHIKELRLKKELHPHHL